MRQLRGTIKAAGGVRVGSSGARRRRQPTWVAAVTAATAFLVAADAVAGEPGDLLWARNVRRGNALAVFPDGSSVVTGLFGPSLTLGVGEPNETTLVSAGGSDLFVARYDEDGKLAWARRAGGSATNGTDRGNAVAAFADGSAVVTGIFSGSAVFGAGEQNETTLVSAGQSDVFVARYDEDGTLAWARRAGGARLDQDAGVAAFPDGSSVVTGFFRESAVFGAGEPSETTLSTGSIFVSHSFLARYDADGSLVWARRAIDQGGVAAIAALPDGSSVVTGSFAGFATAFGPGHPNETRLNSEGGPDVFVARYDADGLIAWARRAGGSHTSGSERGSGVAAFPDGSSVVTGNFYHDTAVFGPGEPNQTTLVSKGNEDMFVARYEADGTLAWARPAGGQLRQMGRSVAAFPDGSSVVTGDFELSTVFGPGEAGETTLVSRGGFDVFVARYDADGTLAWARQTGTANPDQANGAGAVPDGSSIVLGNATAGGATFGAGEPNETTLSEGGAFLARYAGGRSAEIVAPGDVVEECDDHDAETATVHFVFDVAPGSADLLRVRDLTGARTLLEVNAPEERTYGVGPVAFPHGPASVVEIALLDGSTLLAAATFTVQVEDTTAPVVSGAIDQTIELQAPSTTLHRSMLGITVADACDPAPTVAFAPAALGLGTTSVTATARDATGNVGTVTFEVTVVDTTPPEFVVMPEDTERPCAEGGALVAFDVLAQDLSGVVEIACEDEEGRAVDPAGTRFPLGEHVVTCTATDGSGNSAIWSFRVTVFDHEAPVLVCPEDVVVGNDPGASSAAVEFEVVATDECDPDVAVSCEAPWGPVGSGDAFPVGSTTVVCTARDLAGNEASCEFHVTVQDREPPTLTAPRSVTLVTDCAGSPLTVTPSSLGVAAVDNCDPSPTLTVAPASVSPGTSEVVCTAADDDGNSSAATVLVTVLRGPFAVQLRRPLDGNVDNLIHAGRTVPLKVRVSCDNVFVANATAEVESVDRIDGVGTPIANEAVEDSGDSGDDGATLRLDGAAEQYVFNLSTTSWPATSGARFRVTIRVSASGRADTIAHVVLKNR